MAPSLALSQEAATAVDLSAMAPKIVEVQVEFIEMSHKTLTRLMMNDDRKTTDATPLRKTIQDMVDKDDANITSTMMLVARSGGMASSESIHEFIYPTEYEYPTSQTKEDGKTTSQPINSAPPLATAFETRNLGDTMEIEPNIGEDDKYIDLRLVPERVWHTKNTTWQEIKDAKGNITKVQMPSMYTLRTNTLLTCVSGQYHLMAILSPKDENGELDPERKTMVFIKCKILPVMP